MKVIILGSDGYLGWPTSMYLSKKGHEVWAVDCEIKREWEWDFGVKPLFPIPKLSERVSIWNRREEKYCIHPRHINIATEADALYGLIKSTKPDCIIHYAEQPSAPMSMHSLSHAVKTQTNNITGTLNVLFALKELAPECHLIKLGTMGEYGTPNIDIEEGYIHITHNGRSDTLPYPKQPGSFYHASKCHDSINISLACKIWGLRATDLNQGIVYGIDTDEILDHPDLGTSFHYDGVFGTVLNRFITQVVLGESLSVYGNGSQIRGFLNIRDTLRCVEIAMENPPDEGEKMRVFNQFTEELKIIDLAMIISSVSTIDHIADCNIEHLPNPRIEQEDHYYNAKHSALEILGHHPILLDEAMLTDMIDKVSMYKDSIRVDTINPNITWRK